MFSWMVQQFFRSGIFSPLNIWHTYLSYCKGYLKRGTPSSNGKEWVSPGCRSKFGACLASFLVVFLPTVPVWEPASLLQYGTTGVRLWGLTFLAFLSVILQRGSHGHPETPLPDSQLGQTCTHLFQQSFPLGSSFSRIPTVFIFQNSL